MTPRPTKPAKRRAKKPSKKVTTPAVRQIRTSERGTFKRCRYQWHLNYQRRLKPIQEAPALRFGTLVHKALELRYPPGIRRGPKPAETFEKLYDEAVAEAEQTWGIRVDSEEGWSDMGELGVDMLEHFVEEYGRDEEWQVIASEMTFQVPVLDPETGKVMFEYVGTMDGVWKNRMDNGVRIQDWKTTANDATKVGHLILDEQATAYWTWGVDHLITNKILKPRELQALDGMLYTFLRKAKRDTRPKNADGHYLNKDGSVSAKQPNAYFHRELVYRGEEQRERARQRVVEEWREMDRVERGLEAPFKTPGSGPMSHCNYCPFRDPCELHEIGADHERMLLSTTVEWDPYADHEIEEEGKR